MDKLELTDVRKCWELIKPRLEVIARKCDAEWRVEDVYAKCRGGEWTIFVAGHGFVILCQYTDIYRLQKRLSVECAYYEGSTDPFEKYEPFIMAKAQEIGAECVEFHSPRRGFERKGWEVVDMIYRKTVEVEHGQKA